MDRHEIEVFPGGYQYQFEHEVMRRIFRKELKPFIFHMFW